MAVSLPHSLRVPNWIIPQAPWGSEPTKMISDEARGGDGSIFIVWCCVETVLEKEHAMLPHSEDHSNCHR